MPLLRQPGEVSAFYTRWSEMLINLAPRNTQARISSSSSSSDFARSIGRTPPPERRPVSLYTSQVFPSGSWM